MKTLTTLTAAIALIAAQASATVPVQEKPEPETPTACCDVPAPEIERDTADIPWGAIAIIGVIAAIAITQNSKPKYAQPIEPENCLMKGPDGDLDYLPCRN
jgi:hypothetical protein